MDEKVISNAFANKKKAYLSDKMIQLINKQIQLEFNASQKKSVVYNTSFMMLCVESCYAVDTIPIPATKFLPNTKNTIDVNVTNK